MDRLRTLRTFISVAEHRSFAEAGRRLSLSPTTVSRTIAALETSLGVQLLRRTTRSVSLTEEGALFLDHCRAGISEAAVAAAVAGLGVIRTLSYQVTEQLASGQLELLLAEDNASRLPVSLLFQGGRRNHPNVRAFIDAVRQHLRTRTL